MPSLIEIRKALEAPVKDALAAYSLNVPVDWQDGDVFDDSDKLVYVRPSLHGFSERPKTLGPGARVDRRGRYIIGCYLKIGQPKDILDDLAETLKEAYSYDADLLAGTGIIQIDEKLSPGSATVKEWQFRPVEIVWSIGI